MEKSFYIPEINHFVNLENAHFTIVEAGWSYQQHHHKSYELLHCYNGRVTEWIHGQSIELTSGSWMLIAPGVSHSTINHSRDAFSYFSVHFGVEDVDLRNDLKNLNYLLINEPVDKLTTLFLEVEHWALKEPMAGNAPSSAASIGGTPLYSVRQKLRFQSIFLEMLFEVLLFLPKSLEVDSLQQKKLNVAEIELARKIEKILTGAVFTNIAIQNIAKSLFISRSHCNEVFKKVYGLSPRQFISMLKLAKAKALILHSDLSMETISDQLGFSCISSFSRQFRRWTSFSPIQFKNRGLRG